VNFWATWCPPCRKEFPSLGRVRKLFKPAEFEVLAVNIGEDPDTVFSFAGHTEFPVLFDRDSKAMAAWPVRGLPTTFLVDRQGRLAFRATGGREFDDPEIVAAIRQLHNS
jgi:thiol-disulfide isomerase/thioredoxin